MAKSVKELVASMMGPQDGGLSGVKVFPPLDFDQLAQELRLDQRAENAGRAGQPSQDAIGPDATELDILEEIEQLARQAHEVYLAQLDRYETRIRRAAFTSDLRIQIEAAGSNALADFKAEIIHDQNHLHALLQAVGKREEEFNEFRERHGLTRMPRNYSRSEQTLCLMILAIFALLESILNGMFFAAGSEAGLIGGVVQALVLSILNVGVAALYAMFAFPYLFHRSRTSRVVGICATLAFLFWLVGLNLSIGHFRDLFIAGGGSVKMTDLLNHLTTAPLLLSDAKSLILVLLGIGLGLLAVIDVATTRDRYPGYAAVARDRQGAIERYVEENARCLAAMMELRDRAIDDMSAAVELIRDTQFDLQLAIEGRSRLHQNYLAYLNHLAVVHGRLVQRYREVDSRVRRGEPPAYFRRPPQLPGFIKPPALAPMSPVVNGVRDEVVARIDYYIKAFNEKFEQTIPEYQTVGQLGAVENVVT